MNEVERLPVPVTSNPDTIGTVADDWRHRPSAAGWRYRYLIARSSTDGDNEAAVRARVSTPIVLREVERDPDFAYLRQLAINRQLALGNADSTQLARESFPAILQYAVERVTTPAVRDRDQVAWANLVGNAAGALRPQDGPAASVGLVLLAELRSLAQAVPLSPPIVPPSATVVDVPSRPSDGTDAPAPGAQAADTGAP